MAKKSSAYWKKRFELLEDSLHKDIEKLLPDIDRIYKKAQADIEKEIRSWYQRLADNNGVSMAEARKLLSKDELQEFRWSVEEYIKRGEENALDQRWMKQLENASARFHISKLEALKMRTQQAIEAVYGNQLDMLDSSMRDLYQEGYYRTAFELQKGFQIGVPIAAVDLNKLDKIIKKPWAPDGKNFSGRIWENRTKLVNELHTELTRMCITGAAPDQAIKNIAKKMNTSRYNAGRLVMTEAAYFGSVSQKDCFNNLDVEQYEISATLDSHTSAICQEMDGKVFNMKDYEAGVTAPPFHVYCRSCTCPYFDDEFTVGEMRAARGEDGKTYYVPANMKYKEWHKAFVEGDKSGLKKAAPDAKIKAKEEVKQVAEELKVENFPSAFTAKSEIKNTQALVNYVNNLEGADANAVALFNRMGKLENIESNGIPFKISHGKNHAVSTSTYTMTGDMAKVKLTIPKLQGNDLAGQVNTTLHEEMHLMDLYGRQEPKKSGNWFSTSRKSLVDMFKNTSDSMSDDVATLFKQHRQEWEKVYSEVTDKYTKMITELNDSMKNRTFQGSYKDYRKQYSKLQAAMETERDYLARNIMGGGIGNLEDIYDALSGGTYRDTRKVLYGHGASYYRSIESRVRETIANYVALSVTRPDLIDLLRADKPDLVAELDAAIVELLKKAGGE